MLQQNTAGNRRTALNTLEAEVARYSFNAPELPNVLAELTKLVAPPAWMSGAFEWTMETGSDVVPVVFTIREPAGDTANMNIGTALNRSPLLGDVSESRSSQNRTGFVERKFVLKARYDTPEEAAQLKKELEEEAKQAEQKAAEAAAQKTEEAQSEPSEEQGAPQAHEEAPSEAPTLPQPVIEDADDAGEVHE